MTYTEKELRELKELKFNSDATLPNVELSQLDKNKVYLVKVEIDVEASKEQVCENLCLIKNAFVEMGITNILVVPTIYGVSAINVFELEPKKE